MISLRDRTGLPLSSGPIEQRKICGQDDRVQDEREDSSINAILLSRSQLWRVFVFGSRAEWGALRTEGDLGFAADGGYLFIRKRRELASIGVFRNLFRPFAAGDCTSEGIEHQIQRRRTGSSRRLTARVSYSSTASRPVV